MLQMIMDLVKEMRTNVRSDMKEKDMKHPNSQVIMDRLEAEYSEGFEEDGILYKPLIAWVPVELTDPDLYYIQTHVKPYADNPRYKTWPYRTGGYPVAVNIGKATSVIAGKPIDQTLDVDHSAPSKVCSTCKGRKGLGEFTAHRATKDGLDHRCKACRKINNAAYQATLTSEDHLEYRKNRDRTRQKASQFVQKLKHRITRGKVSDTELNITIDEAEKLLIDSNNVCECCGITCASHEHTGKKGEPRPNSMCFDEVIHGRGHIVGNIGMICHVCNSVKSHKSPDQLRSMFHERGAVVDEQLVEYVERYENDDSDI